MLHNGYQKKFKARLYFSFGKKRKKNCTRFFMQCMISIYNQNYKIQSVTRKRRGRTEKEKDNLISIRIMYVQQN